MTKALALHKLREFQRLLDGFQLFMQCQPLLLQIGDLRGEFAVAAHGAGELVFVFRRVGGFGGEPVLQLGVFLLCGFELFF